MHTKHISVRIEDPEGLHARNAAQIFTAARNLNAKIRLSTEEKTARADQILELMALEAGVGTLIEVSAEGEDAEEALNMVAQILQTNIDL